MILKLRKCGAGAQIRSQMSKQVRSDSPLEMPLTSYYWWQFFQSCVSTLWSKTGEVFPQVRAFSAPAAASMTQPAKFTFALGLREMSRSSYKFTSEADLFLRHFPPPGGVV